MFLARFHALLRAHRCCLSVSSWDLSSNFKALGLRWWRMLTCIFPSGGPLHSRILDLTQRRLCESYSSNWSSTLFALGFLRHFTLFGSRDGPGSCETALKCDTVFTTATAALSSLFAVWDLFFRHLTRFFVNLVVWEQTLCLLLCIPIRFLKNWHSGGCRKSRSDFVQVPFKKYLLGVKR